MRIYPTFTEVRDWTGDNHPDGIEVSIELQDQFGDPVKASGRIIFELFEFEKHSPNPRGLRLVNPWIGDLSTLQSQRDRWNRTSRTYGFQLACPQVKEDRSYVLAATYELSGGGRFFDQIVLAAKPTTKPATNPASTEPATQPEPGAAPATGPTTAPATAPALMPSTAAAPLPPMVPANLSSGG